MTTEKVKQNKKYGNIIESSNIHTFTTKNSIRKKINLFCYFGNEILKNKNRFKEDFLIKRTLEVNAPKLIKLFTIIYRLEILKILVKFFIFLRKNPLSILKINNIRNYELVIIAYKIYDPTSFVDELIRYCKSKKILTYGVQINWDALVFPYTIRNTKFFGCLGRTIIFFFCRVT